MELLQPGLGETRQLLYRVEEGRVIDIVIGAAEGRDDLQEDVVGERGQRGSGLRALPHHWREGRGFEDLFTLRPFGFVYPPSPASRLGFSLRCEVLNRHLSPVGSAL